MKLGKKGKDVESFVDKLMAEGESTFDVLPLWFFNVTIITTLLPPSVSRGDQQCETASCSSDQSTITSTSRKVCCKHSLYSYVETTSCW